MKRNLLAITLTAVSLVCLAGLDYSDIVKWGLVRRSDLPAEGYRMVCTTNHTASFMWFVSGSFDIDVEGTPQVAIDFGTTAVPGLPKTLVMDGVAGLVAIGETGYSAGAFTDGNYFTGVGVVNTMNPFGAAGCYSGADVSGSSFSCYYGIANYYYGYVSLYRTDYPDIVTVTTNFVAYGAGVVMRDLTNPRKFARLENGVFKVYEVADVPRHWEFGGVDCPELTFPLSVYNGTAAGYTWMSTDGDMFNYTVYDGETLLWSTGTSLTPNDATVTSVLLFGQNANSDRSLIYVAPSVVTNSL